MIRGIVPPEQFYYAHGQCLVQAEPVRTPRILVGHFFLGDLSPKLFRDTYFFTFLRHPIDRVISQYYFFRRNVGRTEDPEVISAKRCPLREILLRPENNARWSNLQTACLSGESSDNVPNRRSLAKAIHNLRLLDFVGLYNQLQASWSRLAANLGWNDGPLPVCNPTAARPPLNDLDPELTRLIGEKNALDLELYAEACVLFRSRHTPPAHRLELVQIDIGRRETGSREVFFKEIKFAGNGDTNIVARQGDVIRVRLTLGSAISCQDLTVGIAIKDDSGVQVYGTNTWLLGQRFSIQEGEAFFLDVTMKLRLPKGSYSMMAAAHPGRDSSDVCFHWIEHALKFRVISSFSTQFVGLIDLEARFNRAHMAEIEAFELT